MHGVLVFADTHDDAGFYPAGNRPTQISAVELGPFADLRLWRFAIAHVVSSKLLIAAGNRATIL